MAMSSILLKKNYEEYLISNMRRTQADSLTRAKAWMLTAKSLFPNDFYVQYEAYQMERDVKNLKQAADYFTELVKKFSSETGMLLEMQRLTEALQTKVKKNEDTFFLRKMFRSLPNDIKYKVLSTVAAHCKDPMEHCCLMLLLLQELPGQLYQHGEKVIDTLLHAERISQCNHPVNPYRNLLVCNATPTILFTPDYKLPPKLLFLLLQASFEFFVCYIFKMPDQDFEMDILKMHKEEPWMSTKGLHNVWKSLFILLKTVGQQLQWSLIELFSTRINLIFEMNYEKILNMIRMKMFSDAGDHSALLGTSYESSPHDKEIFFCTAAVFFYALHQFSKMIGPKFFSKSKTESSHFILVEGIRALSDDNFESASKKFKYDRDKKLEKGTTITVSRSSPPDFGESLTESFLMAVKVWELTQRNFLLSKEFSHLCEVIEINEWQCFQEFYFGMLIYQGEHKDAMSHFTHMQNSKDEFMKNKAALQLASCLHYTGEHVAACNYLFDVICSFTTSTTSNAEVQIPAPRTSHHLHFITYSLDEILHYTIELLLVIYKRKNKMPDHDGIVLGHLLILSQYNWPREEELLMQCVKQIKQNGSFCFAKFFEYIINPGILEEFMFLTTPAGGSVALDLLPSSTMQVAKQRAITRGINKGAKDELRDAMRKQMACCGENIYDLFVIFIRQERHYIKMIIG